MVFFSVNTVFTYLILIVATPFYISNGFVCLTLKVIFFLDNGLAFVLQVLN